MTRPSRQESTQRRPVAYFVIMLFIVIFIQALLGVHVWIQAAYASWVGVGIFALVNAGVEPEMPQRFMDNLKRFLSSHLWPFYMPKDR